MNVYCVIEGSVEGYSEAVYFHELENAFEYAKKKVRFDNKEEREYYNSYYAPKWPGMTLWKKKKVKKYLKHDTLHLWEKNYDCLMVKKISFQDEK